MKSKVLILTAVFLAVGFSLVFAGNSGRTGTSGAHELQIPIAARGAAMGGAVVANTYGVEAISWNPAGLAYLEGTEAMFTHLSYLADIDVNFVGFGTTMEDFGTLGVFAKIVSIGDMEETTQALPDGTGRVFSPSLSVLGVTYSKILNTNVAFGMSAKFIREDVFEVSATGFALDVGFMYDPHWNGLVFGFAMNNYGPEMAFSGRGFNRSLDGRQGAATSSSFDLPSSLNMSASYNVYDSGPNLATVVGSFKNNNYYQDVMQGGFEYAYDGTVFVRAGYNWADDTEYLYGASFGGGLKVDVGGANLTFDYSWNQTETFDALQFFTLKGNF